MAFEEYRDLLVTERVELADGVVSIRLADPSGDRLPDWEPGSHIDVMLGNGIERQYSLCSRFGDDATWRIAVLREAESRGGSSYVHDNVKAGDHVRTRGPRNLFPLVEAPDYLFLAGGIGVTPLIPMLGQVLQTGATWRFYYGGRTRASMAFRDRLEEYGAVLWPQDEKGLLPLDELIGACGPQTAVYCCGPEPLISAVEETCARLGRPAPHVERFAAKVVDTSGDGGDHAFTVVINSTGQEIPVPADVSIVQAMMDNGVPILTSCAEGVCGTCETKVISGQIVHRDSLLSQEDRDEGVYILPCVSRCAGDRLVLDL